MTRRCFDCKLELPLKSFSRDASARDGIRFCCRKCCVAYNLEHRRKNGINHNKQKPNKTMASAIRSLKYALRMK